MTYKQFLEVNNFIDESFVYEKCDSRTVREFADRICVYLNKGKRFSNLKCYDIDELFLDNYSNDDADRDIRIIRTFLQNEIDSVPNSSIIIKILEINKRILSTSEKDYNRMLDIIHEAYSAFEGSISFDDNIKKLASIPYNGIQAKNYCALDINVLNGLKSKLESYAESLMSTKSKSNDSSTKIVLNNNNYNSNTQSLTNTIDLKVELENVYKNIEDASLSPSEEAQLKETVHKLEELLKSEESKNKKWNRFKEIVSGIAQFSLKAAEILAPLMTHAWPK